MKSYYLCFHNYGSGALALMTGLYTATCILCDIPFLGYIIAYGLIAMLIAVWLIYQQKAEMESSSIAMTLAYYTFATIVTTSGFIALGLAALACNVWLQIFRAYFRQRGWFIFVFLICCLAVGSGLYCDLSRIL